MSHQHILVPELDYKTELEFLLRSIEETKDDQKGETISQKQERERVLEQIKTALNNIKDE